MQLLGQQPSRTCSLTVHFCVDPVVRPDSANKWLSGRQGPVKVSIFLLVHIGMGQDRLISKLAHQKPKFSERARLPGAQMDSWFGHTNGLGLLWFSVLFRRLCGRHPCGTPFMPRWGSRSNAPLPLQLRLLGWTVDARWHDSKVAKDGPPEGSS